MRSAHVPTFRSIIQPDSDSPESCSKAHLKRAISVSTKIHNSTLPHRLISAGCSYTKKKIVFEYVRHVNYSNLSYYFNYNHLVFIHKKAIRYLMTFQHTSTMGGP